MSQVKEEPIPQGNQEAPEQGTNAKDELLKDPFASKSSQILFDAIDQLQSCDASQDIDIPQLVIVGGQSAGKSSLLQSLTSIPFPVSHGLCTRFATRIISRRTPPKSKDEVVITIVKPDFELDHIFNYANENPYDKYVYRAETLDSQTFAELMEEVQFLPRPAHFLLTVMTANDTKVSEKYMGIDSGILPSNKNFATEVLKIELSGPQRAHFSILDIPGHVSNAFRVHKWEMEGIESMIVEYMKKPQNIVICVSDASNDLENQPIFKLAEEHVESTRLIPVFTKCDKATSPEDVVGIATGEDQHFRPMKHGWFVVRNRIGDEGASFDLDEAEATLFGSSPWSRVQNGRRGSKKLRDYLGGLLCAKIREEFPDMQAMVKSLLGEQMALREVLGEPRADSKAQLRYLMKIVEGYAVNVQQALRTPWNLPEEKMQLRSIVSNRNREFDRDMMTKGHTFEFEQPRLLYQQNLSVTDQTGLPPTPEGSPQPKSKRDGSKRKSTQMPAVMDNDPLTSAELRAEIQKQIHSFQSSQLPGLLNPDILPVLYRQQTTKWISIAREHLLRVSEDIQVASDYLLAEQNDSDAYDNLMPILADMGCKAEKKALDRLEEYYRDELTFPFFTTNPEFTRRLEENRVIRFKNYTYEHLQEVWNKVMQQPDNGALFDASLDVMYARIHPSAAQHTEDEAHDILKAYYELSLRSFIEHVNTRIVENMLVGLQGPLKGLSTEYLMSLSSAEIGELAREDETRQVQREQCLARIARLTEANNIAENALRETRPRPVEAVA
ncbi:hypothetical protein PG993_008830 [Apiospora rasikravindrae]|uniref:GED domain-containing protein n=1 Tax=Apiospora rasikravindrae TaxID=990691 RepID=A0ABR1SQV7_9PEZI